MLYNIVLAVHIVVVIALISIILVQRGRSGGLVESLGGVESIFGTKTSAFLVKATVGLVILFFFTSISLAYLSKQKGKSLMEGFKDIPLQQDLIPSQEETPKDQQGQTPAAPEQQSPQSTPDDAAAQE